MRSIWVMVGVALVAGWQVASSAGWYMSVSDYSARPPVAFVRDGGAVRIPIQAVGRPALPHEAGIGGGTGIPFGTRYTHRLPDGGQVTCTHRFRSLTCDGGWQVERRAS